LARGQCGQIGHEDLGMLRAQQFPTSLQVQ
jgi:hypothetical protein